MTKILELMEGGTVPIHLDKVEKVQLLELLGTGAFGSAWKAINPNTKQPYALKVIQGVKPDATLVERIRLEAEVNIPSVQIIPVVGLKKWDDNTYLILFEYFPGASLDDLLLKRSLTNSQKRDIFQQILLGVAAAHNCNVIHRDLKPANILIGDDSQVKIIDFGVSKFKDKNLTLSGEIIGTPPYMALELFLEGGQVADAKTDIYALGQILYELAMGEHFWQRRSWYQLEDFFEYVTQTPPPTEGIDLTDFDCDFFPEAKRVLLKMMKLDPNERYLEVEEIICELGISGESEKVVSNLSFEYPLLIVESGSNKGARTFININDGESQILGRAELAGADTSISRKHLEFSRQGNDYFVRDLGSKNGTMLKGKLIGDRPLPLQPGDFLKVGDIFLSFTSS
jgi:serine/threonine-protein kinase